MAAELEWSEGEPAINVYTSDGYFGAHKDHLALTALIPLSPPGHRLASPPPRRPAARAPMR